MYENSRHGIYRNTHQPTKDIRPFTIEWNHRTFAIRQARHISSHQKDATIYETFEASDGVDSFVFTLSAQESMRLCVKK
jgi:hypothetical protein